MEINPSELQVNQNAPLQATRECSACLLARCVGQEQQKVIQEEGAGFQTTGEDGEFTFISWLAARTDLCTSIVPCRIQN